MSTWFIVDGQTGKCKSQCGIQQNDPILSPTFFTGDGGKLTYAGQQADPYYGKVYDTWQWVDADPFGQPLADGLGFFDTSTTPYTPIMEVDKLLISPVDVTSFTHDVQWGTPDAKLFTCIGCDYNCPTDDQCGQSARGDTPTPTARKPFARGYRNQA